MILDPYESVAFFPAVDSRQYLYPQTAARRQKMKQTNNKLVCRLSLLVDMRCEENKINGMGESDRYSQGAVLSWTEEEFSKWHLH